MVEEAGSKVSGSVGETWANTLLSEKWVAVLSSVNAVAESTGVKVFLVGGIVREAVFSVIRPELVNTHKSLLDIDFAVEGDFERFISEVQVTLSPEKVSRSAFLTAVCDLPGNISVDFAQSRTETYKYPGSLPEVKQASLELDAVRRDFSINAIYIPLSELFRPAPVDFQDLKCRIIDYVGGLHALTDGIVEVLHENSIFDDPTRIFRAVRYRAVLSAFALQGRFGTKFLSSLQTGFFASDISPLSSVSHFRKWVELKKCFESGYPVESVRDLIELGIFEHWPPLPSGARSGFIEKIRRLLTLKPYILSQYGFLIYVSIWWWTHLDATAEGSIDSSTGKEAGDQFTRARSELRLSKDIKRYIEGRRKTDLESVDWLKEATGVYSSE